MARYEPNWYEDFLANGTVPQWYRRGLEECEFRHCQDFVDRTVAALRTRHPVEMSLLLAIDLERKKEVRAKLWHEEQASKKQQQRQIEDSMVCSPGKIPVVRESSPQPETPKRTRRREYIDAIREAAPFLRGCPTPPPRKVNIGPIRPFPSPTPSPSPSPAKSNITAGRENGMGEMEHSAGSIPLSITFTPQEGVLERLESRPEDVTSQGGRGSCEEWGRRDTMHLTYTPQEGVPERLEPTPQPQQSKGNSVRRHDGLECSGGAMEVDGSPLRSEISNQEREEGGNGAPDPGNDICGDRPVLNTVKALFEEFGGRLKANGEPDTGSDLLKPRTALSELGFTSRQSFSTAGSNVDHLDITESIAQDPTAGCQLDFGRRSSVSMSDPVEAMGSGRQQFSGEQPGESHNAGFSFSTPGQTSKGRESTPSLQTGQGGWREMSTTPNQTEPESDLEKEGIPPPCSTSSLGSWGISPQPTIITGSNRGDSHTPGSQVNGSVQSFSLCTPTTAEKENSGSRKPQFRPPTPWAAPQPSPISTNSTLHSVEMPSERQSLESQQTPSEPSLAVQNGATPSIGDGGLIDKSEGGEKWGRDVVDCGVGGSDDDFGGEDEEPMEDDHLQQEDIHDEQIGEENREESVSEMVGMNDVSTISNDLNGAQNRSRGVSTVGTQVSPLFVGKNDNEKTKTQPRRKKTAGGVAKKRKPVERTSLCGSDIGLAWAEEETGKVRRSQRMKTRPLRYWEGETKEYGRDHRTLPTLKGFSMWTPEPEDAPRKKK